MRLRRELGLFDVFCIAINVTIHSTSLPDVGEDFLLLSQLEWINMTVEEVVDKEIRWSWTYYFTNESETRFYRSEFFNIQKPRALYRGVDPRRTCQKNRQRVL